MYPQIYKMLSLQTENDGILIWRHEAENYQTYNIYVAKQHESKGKMVEAYF